MPRILQPGALLVTVRSAVQIDPHLWEVQLTLPGDVLRQVIIPNSAAYVEGVTIVAAAVAALSVPAQPLGYS